MTALEAVDGLQTESLLAAVQSSPSPEAKPAGVASSFGQMFVDGLSDLNQSLLTSQTDLQRFAVGSTQSLHHVMIRLEESRLSFQLMLQVRNRLLESYQDLMKMQM